MNGSGPRRRRWRDLTPGQRTGILVAAVVQVSLLAAALLDLRRRPARRVNGPKPLWVAVSFVSYLGPLAYFRFGRKK